MVKSTAGDICKPGGKKGMLMPFSDGEREMSMGLRAPIYGLALVYCFIGVAIVADMFVGSIEAVTAARRKVRLKSGQISTNKVWNETVSNLSLMALGSSAPEIFLSLIELIKNDMFVGDLGPSTIVGSASFNLLVIVAVCIVAIPAGEMRVIKELNAFYITAAFSLFAYCWLVLILVWFSPDIIDIWEAAVTCGMLPVLIWISYLLDIGRAPVLVRWIMRWTDDDAEEEIPSTALRFHEDLMCVTRPSEECMIDVQVFRKEFRKAVICSYRTESFGAVPDYDYVSTEGTLDFSVGVAELSINIRVLPNAHCKVRRQFLVIVEDAGEGDQVAQAEFDPTQDGGSDSAILTVAVSPPEGESVAWQINTDKLRLACSDWKDQWRSSLYVNGSSEEQAEASKLDCFWHILTLPWRLIFCITPPTSLFSGWACFFGSLVFIAIVTTVISDLAELIGCVLSIPDVCTAITFVALGTSMPDLFASLSAATSDEYADASIVNVTGSNSVNVFLGLGGPWTLAAIYWSLQERKPGMKWETENPEMVTREDLKGKCVFVVQSRNLGFSVLIFSMACVVSIIILILRRQLCGSELGGPMLPKWAAFVSFTSMWVGYVYLVSWRVLRYDYMDMTEQLIMGGTVCSIEFIIACVPVLLMILHWRKSRMEASKQQAEKAGLHEIVSRKSTTLESEEGFRVIEKGVPAKQVSASEIENPEGHRLSRRNSSGLGAGAMDGMAFVIPEPMKDDPAVKTNGNGPVKTNGNGLLVEPAHLIEAPRTPPAALSLDELDFPHEHETPPVVCQSKPHMISCSRKTPPPVPPDLTPPQFCPDWCSPPNTV